MNQRFVKVHSFIFGVTVLLFLWFLSCSPPTTETNSISVTPAVADFGSVQADDPIAFRDVSLVVKNLTGDTVQIDSVELPDGFTYRWIPRNVLPSGGEVTLRITMDTRNFSGDIQQVGYLTVNDTDGSSIPISLRARIVGTRGTPPSLDAPDISFDHKTADLGVLRRDQVVEHDFTFKNLGHKPLKILSIKTMCTCLTGQPTKTEIPPGETGAIVARMEAFNYEGNRPFKSLFIETNDPDEPITNLTISAKIIDPVVFEPEIVLLPHIREGEAASAEVKLLQRGETPLLIDEIVPSSPLLSVQASPLEGQQKGYLLDVTVSPEMPSGKFEEVITIFTKDADIPGKPDTHRPRLILYVKGEVSGDIAVSPRTINFGPASPDRSLRRKVTLSSAVPLDVTSVSLSDPALRASYTSLDGGKKCEVTVEFVPSLPEREIEDTLTITTARTNVSIPVFAAVRTAAK
ncbi:MAG: hypothetical protein Kow0099_09780 [Candidatus Abyssubacteria bacterium]